MSNTRRDLLSRVALGAAAAVGATGAARAGSVTGECEALTGLAFSESEHRQMTGAVEAIIERARLIAALRLENPLPPAELFDPRVQGWRPRAIDFTPARGRTLPPPPAGAEDLAFAPAWVLAGWIARRQLTSRALLELYLERIATHDPHLHCVATLLAERARAEADRCDQELHAGRTRGPLHGLPYGLKDLIDVEGVPTAWGAEPYRDRVASSDATVVKRLREAGAVLIAKLSCGAIAYGDLWYGGQTRNPWNLEEGSSGSSAGSAAAVADGLCAFAIGTETMGSIMAPSARCGVVGLRPTFGRVARTGTMALCWSLDKIGVIGRDPLDTAQVLEIIAGPDGHDLCASNEPLQPCLDVDPRHITLGYRPEWFADGPATDQAALDAARRAGFQLAVIDMPEADPNLLGGIVVIEAAAAFQDLTANNRDDLLSWQDDVAWPNSWRAAHFETAVNYIQAQRLRRRLMQQFAESMAPVDAILHPDGAANLLAIGNHCGYPALNLPVGFLNQPTRAGFTAYVPPSEIDRGAHLHSVPFSVTLTGRLFEETLLVAIAARIEQELNTNFRQRRPGAWRAPAPDE